TPGTWWRHALEGFQTRLVQFFFNAWPLPETAGFRSSLVYAGEMADAGWSILIFPEGRHIHDGSMETFRGGIGLLARELRAPILPIHVEGTGYLLPDDRYWLRLGRARVAIGAPFTVAPDETPAEITKKIEAAVRALAPPGTKFPEA
ncbi:MAG TPA: lysophospholipid acyltransferase family protein, partial [Dongiaceae bacterium]|nr:lysophospholipid acyltransferase family protein [Dongiaceae bacterium]